MQIIRNIQDNTANKRPTAIALGNFDGVHRGHQQLVSQCVRESQTKGWNSCVLTFEPHPTLVLAKNSQLRLLNTYQQKYRLLEGLGIDYLYLLSFNYQLAAMPPEEFVHRYLMDIFHVQKVYVGFNFTFGDRGRGTSQTLQEMGQQNNFAVSVLEPVVIEKEVVSSSLIREKYKTGDIRQAARLLGYWPLLEGRVVPGEQRGRLMGFPTANLELPDYIILPSYGVYAAFAEIEGESRPLNAIVNVGIKPTFGSERPTVEAHIMNYQGELYNRNLLIRLVQKVRPEQRFNGLNELKEQIKRDIAEAIIILQKEQVILEHNFFPGK